jgi:alpha-tubulin suppressor-like RCC1 family protein
MLKFYFLFIFILFYKNIYTQEPKIVIKSGQNFDFIIKSDSTLIYWIKLSNLDKEESFKYDDKKYYYYQNNYKWIDIAYSKSSLTTIAGIKEDGTLWSWGYNNENYEKISKMIKIDSDTLWERVYSVGNNFIGLKKDGTMWVWGENQYFEEFIDLKYIKKPTKIGTKKWKDILIYNDIFYSVQDNGTLWKWYQNGMYNLDKKSVKVFENSIYWDKVCINNYDVLYGLKNGILYKIQANRSINAKKASSCEVVDKTNKYIEIGKGENSILLIDKNAILWGLGDNSYGELGIDNNKLNNKYEKPILINNTIKWKKLFDNENNYNYFLDINNNIYITGNCSFNNFPYFLKNKCINNICPITKLGF